MTRKLYILFTFLAFSSCYDDFDNSTTVIEKEIAGTTMETGITGKLLNVDLEDIESYELTVDGESLAKGQSNFYNYLDRASKKGQLLELYKSDRLVGVANPLLIENDINYIEFASFSDIKSINYSPSNALKIEISSDLGLDLESNAFLNQQNNIISNEVQIDYAITNDVDIVNQIGNLAYSSDNEVMLTNPTILLLNADTRETEFNNQGTQLRINGSKYNSQSLFYLNQFGILQLIHDDINTDEIISVSDLGVFVIANYETGVYTEGTMVKGLNKVSYMPFLNEERKHFSTAKGRWASFFPVNSNVSLDILTPCLDVLENQNLEIKENEDQFEIAIDDGQELIYNVKTRVIDCNGEIEEVQAINVSSGNNSFVYVFNESVINTWIPICKNEFDVSGVDNTLQEKGPQFSWSIDIDDDLTIVSSCDSYENGFGFVVINGEERAYDSFVVESEADKTSLKSSTQSLRLHFDGLSERVYLEQEVRIFIEDPGFGQNGYAISCENSALGCGIENFNVTHFENANDGWLRVSFSGVLWAQTIDPPVAGNYPISGVILSKISQ